MDDDGLDSFLGGRQLFRQLDFAFLGRRLELGRDGSLCIHHACGNEVLENLLGALVPKALLVTVGVFKNYPGEALRRDDAELEVLGLELLLQAVGEVLVALVRDDGEDVGLGIV